MTVSFSNPTYNLESIKNSFSSVNKLRMTKVARQGAVALGMDDSDVIDAIQSITSANFHKTMPPDKMPHLANFDVYRITWKNTNIYTKFQDFGGFMVVSFKRDESR